VRNDVTGDKRGILILTMSTKPMLFFLLLIAHHSSLFSLLLFWASSPVYAREYP
jgi:hypothetical protein